MTALLALFGMKDLVYFGIILAGLAGGTVAWKVHDAHLRAAGEHKIEVADAKASAIQLQHNADVTAAATAARTKAIEDYHEALAALPDVPVPSLVCHAANPVSVPDSASATPGSDGRTVPPEAVGPSFNPAERVLTIGRQGDGQIALLQSLIRSYQAAGVVAK